MWKLIELIFHIPIMLFWAIYVAWTERSFMCGIAFIIYCLTREAKNESD